MLITTYQKEIKLERSNLKVTYKGSALENVKSEKLLGVVIDKHLTWKEHIDKTCKSINRNIALLRRIRKYLSHTTRLTFYKAYIQTHIDYCNTIWGLSPHVKRVHILQKNALRLIMDVPRLTHSAPLFKQCKVMPIHQRVQYRSAVMMYKMLNDLTPAYMTELVQRQSNVSSRRTRYGQNNTLYIPNVKLCVSRRALRYNSAVAYNSLDIDIQNSGTLNTFKYKAYKSFMESF